MKSILAFLSASFLVLSLLSACSNSTDDIGSSLIQSETEVVIHDEFTLTGRTVNNQQIQSRTIDQLLGVIDADGYGKFSSDFVCQFLPATKLETDGVTVNELDSMKLVLSYNVGGLVGDSIAPMGLEVYRLNRALPYPIYSSFDPKEYCDMSAGPIASSIYVGNAQGLNDSIQALSYREIKVDMPLSLAKELFTLYVENPNAYSLPSVFAQYFPGIYVTNSYGSGRVTQIKQTQMIIYYHTTTEEDGETVTTNYEGTYFAVTPEVISNNNIFFDIDKSLQARIDAGENIMVAPVGKDIEITFPLKDVLDYYLANKGLLSVVNTLTMKLPVETISNNYGIEPPENVLMVLSNKKDEFFLTNSLSDDETSFLASYDSTNGYYYFSGLRTYFLNMLAKYVKDGDTNTNNIVIDSDDITFTLTPVEVTTETSTSSYTTTTYVSAITPYIGVPAMAKFNLDKTDISFQFSKQSFK
jgi:hypothetical protein